MNNEKISAHQFKVLVILTFIGTSVLIAPGALISEAKQDAWIAAIFGGAAAFALVWFYALLGEQMTNITLVEYAAKILGCKIGRVVSFTFVLFLLLNSSTLVWVVGDFMTTQLMPRTPLVVINSLFMIVIMIGSRLGIEVIARSSEILFPWAFGGLIFLFLSILPEAKFENILPVFENGIQPIARAGVIYISFGPLTLIAFLMLFPSCISNIEEGKKAFFKGAFTTAIIIVILTVLNILVLGVESSARNVHPTYALAKKISIGNFIERIEAVLGMVWIVTTFFKTIIYFHGAVIGFAQTFGLKDYKPFVLPLGMLIIVLSTIVYPNSVYAAEWNATTWVSYVLTNGLLLPLLLLLAGKLRKQHSGYNKNEN